jgi:hypothetical protein
METRRNTGIEEKNLRICGVYEDLQIVSQKKREDLQIHPPKRPMKLKP